MYPWAVRKRKLASVERSEIFAVFVQSGGTGFWRRSRCRKKETFSQDRFKGEIWSVATWRTVGIWVV